MSSEVDGFFKMLGGSPKTVSLAAGIACLAPYLLGDKVAVPSAYVGYFTVASFFFLALWAILVVRALYESWQSRSDGRKRVRAKFTDLTFEERDVLAAFTVQRQEGLFFPADLPVLFRLYNRDIVTTLIINAPVQKFELADWAGAEIGRDLKLLKGAQGARALEISRDFMRRHQQGEYDRF